MVAEFLAGYDNGFLDGVMFLSSQVGDDPRKQGEPHAHPTGANVVLFAKASVVRGDRGGPLHDVLEVTSAYFADRDEDEMGWDDEVVRIKKPSRLAGARVANALGVEPTMELLTSELEIFRVTQIAYSLQRRRVSFTENSMFVDADGETPF